MTYFKAVKPDGYSFQGNPPVLYEVGATVVPHATSDEPRMCGPGYLHASDAEGEVLVGGSWPCRLFIVSGTPAAGFDGEHGHKGGFLSLTVEREIEAHRALGPNGAQVAAFIERLKTTTKDEWKIVMVMREYQREADAGDAWVAAWAAARAAARATAWVAAWNAAGAAVLALLVRDLITPKQFDLLYAPFVTVIPVDSLVRESIEGENRGAR